MAFTWMTPVVGWGFTPVPDRVTVFVLVKVVPGLETTADPEKEVAVVGQNRTSTFWP